MDGM